MNKAEYERLVREAQKARCMVCGKPVEMEDRCQDGNYLHRECGYATSSR
jgi:hypothetical protein